MTRFCPECDGEYQAWVRECATCGVALSAEPPRDSRPEPYDGPMSPALRFDTHPEAVAVCQYLQAAGVRAYVPEQGWSELGALGMWGRGPTRVWVADGDVPRAERLLEEWREAAREHVRRRAPEPDFFDYDAAGPITEVGDPVGASYRAPSRALRRVARAGAYLINAVFLLNVLSMVWPRGASHPAPAAVATLALAAALLVWLRRR